VSLQRRVETCLLSHPGQTVAQLVESLGEESGRVRTALAIMYRADRLSRTDARPYAYTVKRVAPTRQEAAANATRARLAKMPRRSATQAASPDSERAETVAEWLARGGAIKRIGRDAVAKRPDRQAIIFGNGWRI
jgi:hypothetical protein